MSSDPPLNYHSGNRACLSMVNYEKNTQKLISFRHKSISGFPPSHESLLEDIGYLDSLKCIENFARTNQAFLDDALSSGESHFQKPNKDIFVDERQSLKDHRMIKILLQNLYFEWSSEGKERRKEIYDVITNKLKILNFEGKKTRILVAGAGLCRFPYNLTKEFPDAEIIACEKSLLNVLVSNFILNYCIKSKTYTIYPWLTEFINQLKDDSAFKTCSIPDVKEKASFELLGGEFEELCHSNRIRNSQNIIITPFFSDSSQNILDLASSIHLALKKGGIWIHFGPLNYGSGSSLPLPFDIFKNCLPDMGFELKEDTTLTHMAPGQYPDSMMTANFKSLFFFCVKK